MGRQGVAGKMADDPKNNGSLGRRGRGNPGLNTLDSLYYDYARKE